MKHPCTIPAIAIDFHKLAEGILPLLTPDERDEVAAFGRWPRRIGPGTRDLMREKMRVLTLRHHDIPPGLIAMPSITMGLIDPDLLEQATDNLMRAVVTCLAVHCRMELAATA